jgi:hypothetical protein
VLKAQEVSPVQITVSVTVETTTTRLDELEEACSAAGREAARVALQRCCEGLERRRHRGTRRGTRSRTILTRVGFVTLQRGRARRTDGTRFFPLDELLGLAPHHEASPWVRARGTALACAHPYREAARLLSAEAGAHVDHRALWRWVQRDGDQAIRAKADQVARMFADGEAPARPDGPVPDRLTLAVDATGVRSVEGPIMSAKVAVAFTDSQPVGRKGKRRLARRMIYADLTDSDGFGMALAHELELRYGAHRIPRLMLLGDGEAWISALGGDWLPTARYQLDWWHLGAKVREFCRSDLPRYPRMVDRAFAHPTRLAADLRRGRHRGDLEEARQLADYLERNASHLYTHRDMGPGRWLHGSGPVEKHVELTINRRFKRRGMRWSRAGARNLLALRLEVIAAA